MPPRHIDSRVKKPLRNPSDKSRAALRRSVLAAVSVNVPYNTRSAAKAVLSTPSARALATQLPASRETIRKIINSTSSSYVTPLRRGRPGILTPAEDDALVAFILWLEMSGFPAEKSQVEDAALGFLHSRGIEKTQLSKNWYPQFRAHHPQLRKTFLKAVDKARKAFEASDVEDIEKFFSDLEYVIYDHNIGPSEIWNEDECGICIGCLRDRIQVLVCRTTRSQRSEVVDPSNRESSKTRRNASLTLALVIAARQEHLLDEVTSVINASIKAILPVWRTTPIPTLYKEAGVPTANRRYTWRDSVTSSGYG